MRFMLNAKRKIQKIIWSFFWKNYQLPQKSIGEIVPNFKSYDPKIIEHICLPPYKGESNFIDYSALISLIKLHEPRKILELGTAHGNTIANICLESNADIFTVNALPEQIEGNLITFTLSNDEIGIVYRKNGVHNRVTQIYENTKNLDILKYLPQRSVDFAFLDACHDSDFVVNDFFKILPSLSDRAIVVFHDTFPSIEHWYLDSYVGCMYLRKLGFNVVHIKGSSLGYWSSKDSKLRKPFQKQYQNLLHTSFGYLLYGNQEKFIRGLRWLASGFLKGSFYEDTSNESKFPEYYF